MENTNFLTEKLGGRDKMLTRENIGKGYQAKKRHVRRDTATAAGSPMNGGGGNGKLGGWIQTRRQPQPGAPIFTPAGRTGLSVHGHIRDGASVGLGGNEHIQPKWLRNADPRKATRRKTYPFQWAPVKYPVSKRLVRPCCRYKQANGVHGPH